MKTKTSMYIQPPLILSHIILIRCQETKENPFPVSLDEPLMYPPVSSASRGHLQQFPWRGSSCGPVLRPHDDDNDGQRSATKQTTTSKYLVRAFLLHKMLQRPLRVPAEAAGYARGVGAALQITGD